MASFKNQDVCIQSGVASFFYFLGSNIFLLTHPVFPSTIFGRAEFIHKISMLKKFVPMPPPNFTSIYKQSVCEYKSSAWAGLNGDPPWCRALGTEGVISAGTEAEPWDETDWFRPEGWPHIGVTKIETRCRHSRHCPALARRWVACAAPLSTSWCALQSKNVNDTNSSPSC